ncbi:MAG TPA: type II toxin-antitoxin system prevent-host-death family antitoxin [Bryobacteraceae bacterium]
MTYTVTEAKNRLPELIRQAEAGDQVTISKRGIPVVEIVPKRNVPKRKRILGGLENEIKILDPNWAAPQNDTEAWLRGEF